MAAKKVTKKEAEKVLALYARAMKKYLGEVPPTGPDAAHCGDGPQLVLDWDWTGRPTPTILLEGGVSDYLPGYGIGGDIVWDVQKLIDAEGLGLWIEPYASYAVNIYRN